MGGVRIEKIWYIIWAGFDCNCWNILVRSFKFCFISVILCWPLD